MTIRTLITLLTAFALTFWVGAGCDSDDGDTTETDTTTVEDTTESDTTTVDDTTETDTVDPNIAACQAAIAAKEATHADDLATWSHADAPEMVRTDGDQMLEADYAAYYRDDLANHPGCAPRTEYDANSEAFVSDNEATVPTGAPADSTNLAGYDCAAKVYDTSNVDTTKPIVILVHGNSSGVTSFEEYANSTLAGTDIATVAGFTLTVDATTREMLATKLLAAGYEVISFDARVAMVATLTDWNSDATTGNPFMNINHGWAVPMFQSLVKAVLTNKDAGRKVSLIGHSLGVTVIRDALRRLYNESEAGETGAINPFAHVKDVVLLSGANHGVANGDLLCQSWPDMKGTVGCEMGDRAAFVPTYFTKPLNGPGDIYAAPCADGSYAFGERDKCEGNVVEYTTVTMEDLQDGSLQDEFVSEDSSAIDLEPCVTNELITLADYDTSGYFFTGAPGFFANHFGTPRSDAGVALILDKLAD